MNRTYYKIENPEVVCPDDKEFELILCLEEVSELGKHNGHYFVTLKGKAQGFRVSELDYLNICARIDITA